MFSENEACHLIIQTSPFACAQNCSRDYKFISKDSTRNGDLQFPVESWGTDFVHSTDFVIYTSCFFPLDTQIQVLQASKITITDRV